MTPLAHAGHWLAQLLYLAPVAAMVVAILWAKVRGAGVDEDVSSDAEPDTELDDVRS